MKLHYFPSPEETNTLGTEQLREKFLIGGLFQSGQLTAHYTDLDRMIVGGAQPIDEPLTLLPCKETGTSFFLELLRCLESLRRLSLDISQQLDSPGASRSHPTIPTARVPRSHRGLGRDGANERSDQHTNFLQAARWGSGMLASTLLI